MENLEEFRSYLMSKNHSTLSSQSFMTSVELFRKWTYNEVLEDNEIGYGDIIRYIKTLQKRQLKPQTIRMYLNAIKKYFDFLILSKRFNRENPTLKVKIHGVKKKKTLDIIADEKLHEIYDSYPVKGGRFVRNKCMLGFILFQAFNGRELAELKLNDIDLEKGEMSIRGGLRSNSRILKIDEYQRIALNKYINSTRESLLKGCVNEHVFFSLGTGPKLKNSIQNLIREIKRKHREVRDIKQLRASVIANWTQKYNLREAQYMAGHRYVSSTENYLLDDVSDLSEEINMYHPMQ